MSIVTKTGDGGKTDGSVGQRVSKAGDFADCVGTLDELSAVIGVCRQGSILIDTRDLLRTVQHRLLEIGAGLYTNENRIDLEDIKYLETYVFNHEPDLDTFILPNNMLHLARAVARRLERHLVSYNAFAVTLDPKVLKYVNRLSDALYAAAVDGSSSIEKWEQKLHVAK